jgi:hypothetical protein
VARRPKTADPGGGGPAITAGVVGTGTAEVRLDADSAAAGQRIEELAVECLKELPTPSAVRSLARLVRDHAEIVLRLPLFHERMDRLLRNDGDAILRRIFSEMHQGRPLGMPYVVIGLVEQLRAAEGCSIAKAAQILARRIGSDFNITAETIRNMHSEHREAYALFRASKFVPAERLTARRWSR